MTTATMTQAEREQDAREEAEIYQFMNWADTLTIFQLQTLLRAATGTLVHDLQNGRQLFQDAQLSRMGLIEAKVEEEQEFWFLTEKGRRAVGWYLEDIDSERKT